MHKKSKLIKKISIVVILIISILISTMPYKPKISENVYSTETVKTMASLQIVQKKSLITINKVDSKTNEGLEGVKFELQPAQIDIIDELQPMIKHKISYWDGDVNLNNIQINEGYSFRVMNYNVFYFEGWSTSPDSEEVEYNVGDTIIPTSDMNLYAVIIPKNLNYFKKDLVKSKSELIEVSDELLTGITFPESDKVSFSDSTQKVTLLYKITARGDNGFIYSITDDGATYLFGDPLNGTIDERGEINSYVIKTFSLADINSDGNLENTARITPGINSNYMSSSTKIVSAEDNTPTYTVTYVDGTPDHSLFGEMVFTGIKFGEKTPEFTGSLEREGYDFQGWAPAVCERVEFDITYIATWLKRRDDSSKELVLDTVTSISQTPSLLKSFANERMLIINQDIDNYTFIKDENGVYKSNNQGVSNSEAQGCIPIDLSEYEGDFILNVNAAISCEEDYDYGYVQIMEEENLDVSREFVSVTGVVDAQDYKVNIKGGKKYRLLFGYCKDRIVDDGEDTFTINSVKIILNSDGNTENLEIQTDNTGKVTCEIPNGRYVVKEISTQPGYKVLEYPVVIDVINNQIKIIENLNAEDNITILENNELKIENTTCRVIAHYYIKDVNGEYTEEKIVEDKILKGIEGESYKLEHEIYLEKDGIEYELEYERKNEKLKYVVPENESGVFRNEDIHVKYYYQPKKKIIINKIWIDNNDSLGIRPDSINVTLTATVENENGEAIEYLLKNVDTTVTLRSENGSNNGDNWTYKWVNLDTHDENGKEIFYCVDEIEVPEEYYSVVSFIDYEHFEIANYKYGSIKVIKVDSKDNNIKLGGADFKLEKLVEKNGEIIIDEYFEPLVLTTSTEEETLGEVKFNNLEYGKYRLTETKAPNGYSLQKKSIDIEITQELPDYVGEVINKEKTVLPDTGGNGSIILTMMGVFLIAIAIKIKK